jgi:uncharacterized protein DUF3618
MSSPDQIEQQIERTRTSLSGHVDELEEKVSPGKAVGRRVDRVRSSMTSIKERVMGSSDDGTGVQTVASSTKGAVSSAASNVGDAASSVGQSASQAPQAARRQTHSNPLAAGVIAFGVGWLLSSLAPASEAEKNLALQAEEKAQSAVEPLKEQAQEMAQNLKGPAQQAAHEVTSTAQRAADDVKSTAQEGVAQTREQIT